nr:hypothetical protein [Bacteroides intestinalis]
MEFNKDGKIDRYYNLDEILRLDLDQEIKKNFEEKFGRTVYFDSNGSCKMGKLCGLEKNYQLTMIYYIVEAYGKKMFVPINQSITLL